MVLDERRARALAELLAATPRAPQALASMTADHTPGCSLEATGMAPMPGRPEHRDNVQSDGTWHVQRVAARSGGFNRTGPVGMEILRPPDVPSGRLHVIVEAGGALLINTRLPARD